MTKDNSLFNNFVHPNILFFFGSYDSINEMWKKELECEEN